MTPLERLEAFTRGLIDSLTDTCDKTWLRPAEAALVEAEAESEVHEPQNEQCLMTWHGWAVPAILEVLAEEYPDEDEWEWCERIAPLIADRIACDPKRAIEALSYEQRISAGYEKLARQLQTPEGKADQELHRSQRRMPS